MIVFRYTKKDGAEYLSHLDLLRHIDRTLRRAGIPIYYSQGFHPHPRIFLNNPLGTGICSVAEYGAVETDWQGDFMARFNACAPRGIRVEEWGYSQTNPNFAYEIKSCLYALTGVNVFDVNDILGQEHLEVTDSRNRAIDMRPRIKELYFKGDTLYAHLGCGTENLRPDFLLSYLIDRYGSPVGTTATEILKLASYPSYSLNNN
jgi:radical SAM-linked protein